MSRMAYVDGRYMPLQYATVNLQDRGYQFADGVYEVIARYSDCLLDGEGHLDRLERSLDELSIPMPCSRRALMHKVVQLCKMNPNKNGLIYMQVTRGVAPRKHTFKDGMKSCLTMVMYPAHYPSEKVLETGVRVITTEDERWANCHIKAIGLLPNVMAKMKAQTSGAFEAWQVNAQGEVTEGSLSNAHIIKNGVIITHPANHAILGGITRDTVLSLAPQYGLKVEERAFTLQEAKEADEAFVTGASSFVMPVVQIDDTQIANGKVGNGVKRLIEAYADYIKTQPHYEQFNKA